MIDQRLRRALVLLDGADRRLRAVVSWPSDPEAPAGAPWGWHAVPTLISALDGVVRVEGPRRRIDLQPGEALLLEPACLHRHVAPRGRGLAFCLGVLPAWCDLALVGAERLGWFARLPRQPTCDLLESALLATGAGERLERTRAALAQALAERHDEMALLAPGLWPMVRLLWNCTSDAAIDPAAMVRASGLSRAQAYRVFRDGYGTSMAEAIVSTRLSMAGWLLRRGVPVAEAARRAGFPGRATFTRVWRKRHGTPPSRSAMRPPTR